MARRYSYDLRIKLFKAVDDGLSIVKAYKIFNISRNTIYSTNVGNRYIICQYEKSIKKIDK
ncbi:transposase family protein [Orientia tsutsugamushi str. Gilliam]|uniref:Transposase family protein n=1 Tax=Orientia tsutsugamushi str. Gilliam TaxID=1359184 RepID=A0A0F3MFA1_ORITS|nr:helix-turn-helix domain-containing protein [Orientia tsutsugamushi]KJV51689.1 transposase family protein [Orientia tsutsugamushi str. Gilliam]KJV53224.1 transposase family protein [Orientia tsutsugamushi str. Gilliam]